MTETQRINEQLRRAFEGQAWHGPAVREVLEGITSEKAARRLLAGAHSAWEIVLHMSAWQSIVRRRLESAQPILAKPEEDWRAVGDTSEAAWRKTLGELKQTYRQLRVAIARLPEKRLNDVVPGKQHSVYDELHGVVQHNLYHAGQIALLKKALG